MQFLHGLLCLFLVISVSVPITSKRFSSSSGRHSYPTSSGHSGGGSHSYPSSGGLSGGGRGYPSSGGSHGYPSSGGSHGYPSGGSQGYPSGGSHAYPSSNGMSGSGHAYPSSNSGKSNHGYPSSGSGLSGNSPSNSRVSHTTNVHYHYNYNPPQQIRYTPVGGGPPMSYPVYHGQPPSYVYKYQDSGSKYGTLLAGLALLNLGTLAGTAYAASNRHSNYKPQPGEICKFGLRKDNGDYEETRIDCQLITSFIFQEEAKTSHAGSNGTVTTTTVTNVTTVNITNGGQQAPQTPDNSNPLNEMHANNTLVPINATTNATGILPNNTTSDHSVTSSVTITTTNTTTVTSALDVKGKPLYVTPGMQCYVLRHTSTSNMKRAVPCGLLQTYAQKSLKKNSATMNTPVITVLTVVFALLVVN